MGVLEQTLLTAPSLPWQVLGTAESGEGAEWQWLRAVPSCVRVSERFRLPEDMWRATCSQPIPAPEQYPGVCRPAPTRDVEL